jgi:hypothetical protein
VRVEEPALGRRQREVIACREPEVGEVDLIPVRQDVVEMRIEVRESKKVGTPKTFLVAIQFAGSISTSVSGIRFANTLTPATSTSTVAPPIPAPIPRPPASSPPNSSSDKSPSARKTLVGKSP